MTDDCPITAHAMCRCGHVVAAERLRLGRMPPHHLPLGRPRSPFADLSPVYCQGSGQPPAAEFDLFGRRIGGEVCGSD